MASGAAAETNNGPSFSGSVLADIGGDVGAAVLYVPSSLAGLEIEIRPVGGLWDGTHTAVRERHLNGTVTSAAFFGSLRAGRYDVRVREQPSRSMTIEVKGGRVSETQWGSI